MFPGPPALSAMHSLIISRQLITDETIVLSQRVLSSVSCIFDHGPLATSAMHSLTTSCVFFNKFLLLPTCFSRIGFQLVWSFVFQIWTHSWTKCNRGNIGLDICRTCDPRSAFCILVTTNVSAPARPRGCMFQNWLTFSRPVATGFPFLWGLFQQLWTYIALIQGWPLNTMPFFGSCVSPSTLQTN